MEDPKLKSSLNSLYLMNQSIVILIFKIKLKLINKMSTLLHPKYNVEWTTYDRINFSTAKQQFSFPKSNRFPEVRKQIHELIGYDLPNTRSFRATSFGFGHRSELQAFKKGKLFQSQ